MDINLFNYFNTISQIKKQYYDELIKEHKVGDMSPNEDIYILICKNKNITTQQIADTLRISKRTVLRKLATMTDKVVHKGLSNGGYWEFVEKYISTGEEVPRLFLFIVQNHEDDYSFEIPQDIQNIINLYRRKTL